MQREINLHHTNSSGAWNFLFSYSFSECTVCTFFICHYFSQCNNLEFPHYRCDLSSIAIKMECELIAAIMGGKPFVFSCHFFRCFCICPQKFCAATPVAQKLVCLLQPINIHKRYC